MACRPSETEGGTRFLGSFVWSASPEWFGGFSAIELSSDGLQAWVLTDRSRILRADIIRKGDQIARVDIRQNWHLKSSSGVPLGGYIKDSEGLAVVPDGPLFISFEGTHRITRYDTPDQPSRVLSDAAQFQSLRWNKSLEALAIDADGLLYAIPEGGLDASGAIPVFRFQDETPLPALSIRKTSGFRPVGADFGPDGRLYVLERGFSPLGFRTQLRRWDLGDILTNETTLLRTSFGTHDNLEGVSIWRDAGGHLRATMIADDNFNRLQQTEIVEYRLPD